MFAIETGEIRTFEFSVDGKAYSIPVLDAMPYTLLKEFRNYTKGNVDGVDVALWAVEHIFEAYAPGCTEKLTMGQLYALVDAYVDVEKVGE